MDEKIYQAVLDRLSGFFPPKWKRLVFFAGYTEGSYTMKFHLKDTDDHYYDCFKIAGVSRIELIRAFMDIDGILTPARKELSDGRRWSVLTMTVEECGDMKAEYEYDDHSEDMVDYEEKWEKMHLV